MGSSCTCSTPGAGIVQGFRIIGGRLIRMPGSARPLRLANSAPPFFLTSPGRVGFAPDGLTLLVTTKASENSNDVFQVRSNGRLSSTPLANPSGTPVPFAFTFTPTGRLAVGEAGVGALSTYLLTKDGTLTDAKSLPDGQVALCWITRVGPSLLRIQHG